MDSVRQTRAVTQGAKANPVQASTRADARKVQARGMDFEAGQALFAPPPGPAAPVQRAGSKSDGAQASVVQRHEGGAKDGPGGPGGDGKTMGQSLVGHMEELNDSPALKNSKGTGKYNVGYRPAYPELPPGSKVTQDGNAIDLQLPEGMDPDEENRIRVEYFTAQAEQHGHVTDVWKDDGDSKYFEESNPTQGARFSWKLKGGASASEALGHWLKGADDPTVADCASALVALQLQSLCDRVGDATFDKLVKQSGTEYFISPDPMKTPLKDFLSMIELYQQEDKGQVGLRPLTEGDAVYFRNHPDYKKYAPNGLWSGENCIYMGMEKGQQVFSGFGVPKCTEQQMNQHLIEEFNKVAPKDKKIGEYQQLIDAGGGLQTSIDKKGDEERGSPKGLRLDEGKVAAKLGAKK